MNKKEAIILLKSFIGTIESLDENEFQELLHNVGRNYLSNIAKKRSIKKLSKVKSKSITKLTPEDMRILTGKLQVCNVRDDAREILEKDPRLNLKPNLNDFARFLKIHISKNDNREHIEDKIIEYVVGTKLRSEAILSLNLKGQ